MLVASVLCFEAGEVEIAPAAESEIAELLDDTDAYAGEMLRLAGGNHDHLVHHDCSEDDPLVRALDLPELPYSDGTYVEMWDRVAAEWRERNRFGQLRDQGRSRSSVLTNTDLQKQLAYLEGAPEMQRAAIAAFRERQAERDAEAARHARRDSHGKQAARAFMKQRRERLKTLRRRGKCR